MNDSYEWVEHKQISGLTLLLVSMQSRTAHCHGEFEIGLVLKGSINLVVEGRNHALSEGDIFLINPIELHSFHTPNERAFILFIQFSPSLLQSYYPKIRNAAFSMPCLTNYFAKSNIGQDLRSILILLGQYFFGAEINYELKCLSLLNLLVEQLFSHVPTTQKSERNPTQAEIARQRISRILEYINENYPQKILLRDLAQKENLSLYYLSHFFTANMNMTFQEYINEVRFEHASYLLENTNRRIIDISLECGFSDVRYLDRAYRKHFGCSPQEHRHNPERRLISYRSDSSIPATIQHIYSLQDSISLLSKYQASYILT